MRTNARVLSLGVLTVAMVGLSCCAQAQTAAPQTQSPGQPTLQAPEQPNVLPVPKPCAILEAHVGVRDPDVRRNEHATIDTQRIQYALSECAPGRAVVLEAEGDKNAFLSAPLIVPRGVTLFVDEGVTLLASRNPRDYDVSPSSCGAAKTDAVQCKPFVFSYQAAYSAIMGAGTIDGQGGTTLGLGIEEPTWWQLQQSAQKKGHSISVPDLVSDYESQGFQVVGVTLRNAAGAHLAIYKTIGFVASKIVIDSPAHSAAGPGIVLSNAVNVKIDGAWITTPAEAISLKASILGPTSHANLHDIHIYGGRGIVAGDARYGDVNDIEIDSAVLDGMQDGLTLQLAGSDGAQMHGVHFHNICMAGTARPLRALDANGQTSASIPAANAVQFENVSVAGKGVLGDDGLKRGPAASCGDLRWFHAPPGPQFAMFSEKDLPMQGTKRSLVVAQDGSGDFRSVQSAVDALPENGGDITIKPGTYREVVTIRKSHVYMSGDPADPAAVTIVYGNGAPKSGGTFNTATVFVEADNVSLDHMTITNGFTPGGGHGQAVALAVNGDRDTFRFIRFHGNQDTLFAASKYCYGDYGPCVAARQYFADCFIDGNIDFIFGDSVAVFERCELHGNAPGNVMFTAQDKHSTDQESGYVFDHCTLTADPRTQGIVALGRPWRPHASVVYLHTRIDANVIPAGWEEWPRFGVPSLPVAYYAEFDSTGPGADPTAREKYSHQLTAAEADRFSPALVLAGKDGWNPTGQ
ncbi:MAG: pectinesterase family protein [Candidatus Acidiferrales bacterium]